MRGLGLRDVVNVIKKLCVVLLRCRSTRRRLKTVKGKVTRPPISSHTMDISSFYLLK